MRDDSKFEILWNEIIPQANHLDVEKPLLPRLRRMPRRYDEGSNPHLFECEESFFRKVYFEILDMCINGINARFNTKTNYI